MNPRQIIRREYGDSPNFMTPTVVDYGTLSENTRVKVVYELSKGRGFENDTIYGVSVVSYFKETGETLREVDMSCCKSSHRAALEYIGALAEGEGS